MVEGGAEILVPRAGGRKPGPVGNAADRGYVGMGFGAPAYPPGPVLRCLQGPLDQPNNGQFPMPRLPLADLSDEARVWVFAADRPISPQDATRLLAQVDEFLAGWHAHGTPLTSAREWRDDRFLVIAADGDGASGCSIDGLFRALKALGTEIGANLVTSGLVFYRDAEGVVRSTTRPQFSAAAASGDVSPQTPVFDSSLTRLGDVRRAFERPASESWHAALFPVTRR